MHKNPLNMKTTKVVHFKSSIIMRFNFKKAILSIYILWY